MVTALYSIMSNFSRLSTISIFNYKMLRRLYLHILVCIPLLKFSASTLLLAILTCNRRKLFQVVILSVTVLIITAIVMSATSALHKAFMCTNRRFRHCSDERSAFLAQWQKAFAAAFFENLPRCLLLYLLLKQGYMLRCGR